MKRQEKVIIVNPMIGIIPEMIGDCGYDGLRDQAIVRILERVYRFILMSRNQQLIKKMLDPDVWCRYRDATRTGFGSWCRVECL
jgi:hypothetical protein